MRIGRSALSFAFLSLAAIGVSVWAYQAQSTQLVTGKFISPAGTQTDVGSFPANMVLSPDGRFVVVTNTGFREQLSVLDAKTGALISKYPEKGQGSRNNSFYYGLVFNGSTLYASRGSLDKVDSYSLSDAGTLTTVASIDDKPPEGRRGRVPNFPAGLALSEDGKSLYVVNNQTHQGNDFKGSLDIFDLATSTRIKSIPVGGFPLAVAAANGKAYVSNERDGNVSVVDPAKGTVLSTITTGDNPTSMTLDSKKETLFVSNSGSDIISVIDTHSDKVTHSILLRSGDLLRVAGATPQGLVLTPDGKRLFVAMGDLNAVAIVNLDGYRLEGYIPAGWYPTSVAVGQDGSTLLVANAKGVQTRNPNGKDVNGLGQYGPNIIEGTVSRLDVPTALRDLKQSTLVVLNNNLAANHTEEANRAAFVHPAIEHVIYVIKENRTYDQFFGDLPKANGDASLCLFPREVTPNQHALAERFGTLDNFYVCAEVSADGWNWSTSGMASAYTERNVFYNYSGRGRAYDFEGTNNGVAVELKGMKDVATAPNGYIWDQCARQKVSYRNYGWFVTFEDGDKKEAASKKALQNHTNGDFRHFDMAYADSDAWLKHGLKAMPGQLAEFNGFPSRFSAWRKDFDGFVAKGEMPKFQMLRLPKDHTTGTTPGLGSPRACVADNDYAVGQLVDAVSHSPFWKNTVICVVEDDAQAGFDHVDSHRAPALIISAYNERGKLDSRFYNTDSMLRTMELLLGMKPLNSYDAVASPIALFSKNAVNSEPYDSILPLKEIIGDVNESTAYRAADSARLISRFTEESLPDIELNDILWGAIKGAKTPRPTTPHTRWKSFDRDDREEKTKE